MKIVSEYKELEGQVFDNVKQCAAAEKRVEEQRKAVADKERDASKLRKSLAAEIDVAEKNLSQAYAEYDKAKEAVDALVKKFHEERDAIMNPAKKAVMEAESHRKTAILNYTRQCGPYQKTYTGDKAEQEFIRMSKNFDAMVNDFWKDFFRF